jgi:hypothetical protein
VRNVSEIDNLADEVKRVVEDEWGYSIDTSSDDLEVFRQLARGEYAVPDDDIAQTLLENVIQQTRTATVGVDSASAAIGLVFSMESSFDSAAVGTSSSGSAFSSFDLVATIGRYSGIEPVGDTERSWEQARSQVRDQVMNEKVESIRDDVRELSQTWGYDDETIRQRVTSRIPALSAPQTHSPGSSSASSGGSLGDGSLGSSSSSSEDLKKYIALALIGFSIIGFILIGAYAADLLPGSGDDGSGDGTSGNSSHIGAYPSVLGPMGDSAKGLEQSALHDSWGNGVATSDFFDADIATALGG